MSQKNHPLKWYHQGLSFECTGCGKCCTGSPGYIWVSLEEIVSIAKHLKLSVAEFSSKYLRKVGERYSLIEKDRRHFDCIFLKEKMCQIYAHRPSQCRTYPFWPSLLDSKKNWEEEAMRCEGIRPGAKKWSQDEIEQVVKQNEALG